MLERGGVSHYLVLTKVEGGSTILQYSFFKFRYVNGGRGSFIQYSLFTFICIHIHCEVVPILCYQLFIFDYIKTK